MIFGNIIIAPLDAPQIFKPTPVPPKPPRLDWQDELLLERLREAGTCKTWSLLNVVADEQCPRDRTDGRLVRLRLLERLKHLRRLGLVFAFGRNRVSSSKPDRAARRPAVRRPRRTVAESGSVRAVSADAAAGTTEPECRALKAQAEVHVESHAAAQPQPTGPKTESAPSPEFVSAAASALARLPRNQPRKPTGWLHGQHCWRRRLLVLPDGEVAPLYWCCRGRVLLAGYRDDPLVDENTEFIKHLLWAVRREKDVRLYKHPEAVLLGRQKRGVRERPSALKAAAARANGRQPPGPGRRRGRPSRHQAPYLRVSPQADDSGLQERREPWRLRSVA
jgi:hypothetical protein